MEKTIVTIERLAKRIKGLKTGIINKTNGSDTSQNKLDAKDMEPFMQINRAPMAI
jgi:hypothetical protein